MNYKILIVEDDIHLRKGIADLLVKKNCAVFQAANGMEAFKLLSSTNMDLIITDVEMPLMNGIEFLTRLRAIDSLQSIPVIVVSGFSQLLPEKYLELGAAEFIEKPISGKTLMKAISSVLTTVNST